MFSKEFLTDAGIRVLRTFVQALVGALGLDGAGAVHMSWNQALAVACSAAVLSALTQLAALDGRKVGETTDRKSAEGPGPVIHP